MWSESVLDGFCKCWDVVLEGLPGMVRRAWERFGKGTGEGLHGFWEGSGVVSEGLAGIGRRGNASMGSMKEAGTGLEDLRWSEHLN